MQNILTNSMVYRLFAAIYAWFSAQWQNSRFIKRFLSPGFGVHASECSILYRFWCLLHHALNRCFVMLRFDRLLHNSIFTKPFIWFLSTFALAPVLPTMAAFALTVIGSFSLIAAFACDKNRSLVFSPVNKFVLLYALVYITAIASSVNVSGSLQGGALTVLFVLFTLVSVNSIRSRRHADLSVFAFVLCGAAVSFFGIYQYVFGANGASSWVDSGMFSDISTRVFSTLGNPNMLAAYLLLLTPFSFACVLISDKPVLKLLFAACLGLALVCMLLTFARGAWLGLIVASALFLVLLDRRFIFLGFAAIFLLYFTLPDVFLSRFLSIGNLSDTSTAYRLSIWLGSISMLRDYWFTGIGPGTAAFNKIYPMYSYNTAAAQHSHNLFLQIICDAGICGIIVFLMLLFAFFRSLSSAISRESNRKSKILQIAALSSVFGFLTQGMADYSFYNYRVALVFWCVVGLGSVLSFRSSLKEV